MQLQLDPNIPANLSPEELRDFKSFLDVALDGLTTAAGGEVFATGNGLLGGLALTVVVLTGVKIAFGGNIQPWELVRVVIGLWVPWVMLQFYTTPIPGMAFTFPGMLAAGGNWLHELLIGDAVYSMQTELGNLIRSLAANLEAQAQQGNVLGLVTGWIHALITVASGFVMLAFVVLMLLLLAAVTYAQVIWAQIALAVLIILGPIFIPFLVFDPLSFLFWGWFRAMVIYSLYAVMAGGGCCACSPPWESLTSRAWGMPTWTCKASWMWVCGCWPSCPCSSPGCWPASSAESWPRCSSPVAARQRSHGDGDHGGSGGSQRRNGGGEGRRGRN